MFAFFRRGPGPWIIVAAWLLAMGAGLAFAPRLHDLAVTDPSAFFPADASHSLARAEIERHFPGASPLSQVAVVVEVEGGFEPMRDRVDSLAASLRQRTDSRFVTAVLSPSDDPALMRRLVSPDSRAALILVQLSAGFASEDGARVVDEVEQLARNAETPGFKLFLSGDATLGRDYDRAIDAGGQRSAWATLILVAVILLLVYRSPVAAGVSVLMLGAALGVTFGLVTAAAAMGLSVAYQARAFLVAIVYGVGTDYGLLLFARVREEAAAGSADPITVAERSSRHVLVGSAFAVAVACLLMGQARFGLFRFSGVSLALGVGAALAAVLTLAPALMRLMGNKLFWPGRAEARVRSGLAGRIWPLVARLVLAQPLLALVLAASLMAPFVVRGFEATPTFENEIDIPSGSPSAAGYAALSRHFKLAAVAPLAIVMQVRDTAALPGGWRSPAGLGAIYAMTERLASAPGVARVYSATRPLGEPGLFEKGTLRGQLAALATGLGEARGGALSLAHGLGAARMEAAQGRREVGERRAALEAERRTLFAMLAAQRYEAAKRDLKKLGDDLGRIEDGMGRAEAGARRMAAGLELGVHRLDLMRNSPGASSALDRLVLAPEDLAGAAAAGLARSLEHYTAVEGSAALFEVELTDAPNSPAAVQTLAGLRARLPLLAEIQDLKGAGFHIGGATPITADLESITREDLQHIGVLVVAGVFVLLVVLLGDVALSAVVTLYLLASYYAALGALLVGVHHGYWPGIDWKAPFFLFVLLVALGADYGVFLLGRAREEAARHGFRAGLAAALTLTGPVVSSCGIVLAGTFAALALSPVAFLQQVGLGVTFGVLVDTLLVRPFLLPATALLLHRKITP